MLINREDTSFNFFRFVAAVAVYAQHSFDLLGYTNHWMGNAQMANLAVSGFFVVCGFFVTHSFINSKNIFHFYWKRFLRIQPAMLANSLFIFVTCTAIIYFSSGKMVMAKHLIILKNVLPLFGYVVSLPDLFTHNPATHAVNGSLWSLVLEERLYLLCFVFIFLKHKYFKFYAVVLLGLALVCAIFFNNTLFYDAHATVFNMCIYFLTGVVCYLYKDILFNRNNTLLNVGGLLLMVLYCTVSTVQLVLPFYFGPWLLSVCLRKSVFNKWNVFGDYSFSIYIYAYFIQQMLIMHYSKLLTPLSLFIYSSVILMPICYCSWHFIEKKSLEYRNAFWQKSTLH